MASTEHAAPAVEEALARDRVDRDDRSRLPLVIGHRGASGDRPEHTLASYRLAIDLGADYIEPDLVATRDHVLVARHDNELGGTTDVADHPGFADRHTTKTIDGVAVSGWFSEDFTLAELRTLRARERLPQLRPANTAFDGLYQVPTLQEVIDLATRHQVGIYPETKHPSYFAALGLSLTEPLVQALDASGYRDRTAPVFIQSLEVANLTELRRRTRVPLVQLLAATGRPYDLVVAGDPRTYQELATPEGLGEIAGYADGVGPNKDLLVPRDAAGNLLEPTSFVADAHRAGLVVHAWTFRTENAFLPAGLRQGDPASPRFLGATGDAPAELRRFFRLGVDGLFTDHPGVAVAVRHELFGTKGVRSARPGPLQDARLGG